MPQTLGPKTITAIRSYIDEGIPVEDLGLTRDQIERVRVAERCYERLQQDPLLDPVRYLTRVEGRTRQQASLDRQVVAMFVTTLNTTSKALWNHRIEQLTIREARIAEQTGDARILDRAITHMEKARDAVAEEEKEETPFQLPPVFVRVDVLDPTKTFYDEEATQKLTEKYGGQVDPLMQLVNQKTAAIKQRMEQSDEEEPKEMTMDYED